MPEALARSDFDFSLRDYAHSPVKSSRRRLAQQSGLASLLTKCLRYPIASLAFIMLVGIVASFLVNALFLQNIRHPSPLFGRSFDVSSTALKSAMADRPTVPVPAPRPVQTELVPAASSAPAVSPATPPAQRSRSLPIQHDSQENPTIRGRDQIAMLLKGGLTPQAISNGQSADAQTSTTEQRKSILAAQKALIKLGYVLKPDGTLGAGTRSAIEQYERDQGMIVRGDLTPKIMRELANKSGITVQ